MKKYLSLLLAIVFCLGCFAACGSDEAAATTTAAVTDDPNASTIADAVNYLKALYKDAAESTPRDYDMPAKMMIGTTQFTVTWKVNVDVITIKESKTSGYWTIDIPDKNDAELKYVLTATVKDSAGNTKEVSFNRSLPVIDNKSTTDLEEGKEYLMFMTQMTAGKVLYATTETQNDKYLKSTEDASKAAVFFAEVVDGGYKFYTTIDGVKNYVYAYTVPYEDGSGKMSKYLCYSAENASVWSYQQEVNAWFTTCEDGTTYVIGTYSSYDTFCISESTHITADNTGKSQFPAEFLEKGSDAPVIDQGEEMTEEEVVNAAYELEVGGALAGQRTLTGVIISVDTAFDSGYNNVTVTIVVAGLTDKPIQCFRLKGDGADKIGVGDTITVTGSIINYDNKSEKGKVEFNSGCTLDSYTLVGGNDDPETTEKPDTSEQPETTEKPETSEQPATGATLLEDALADGMKVVIVNGANKKALSSQPSQSGSYYQKGVDVTLADKVASGYADTEIWTVVANDDGTFSFEQGGQKLGMQDDYSSMSLGAVNNKWEVISLGDGLYNIKNTVRGNFIEWYASKNNWSTHSNSSEATDPLFQLSFYVVG